MAKRSQSYGLREESIWDVKLRQKRGLKMATNFSWTLDLGASVSEGGVHFRVWAPKASSVSLTLMGDKEPYPMSPEDRGYFSTFLQGLKPGRRYCYVLNQDQPKPDPVSRSQPEGVHGPSEITDPRQFQWEDQDWHGIPLEETILYEIHTGTFTQEGTFKAIIPHLDYLKNELGVTTVELMPVAQFPGERNWGYDGTYLYAPQNSYGGPYGLKSLVNACHQEGLAVVLDVVYNHFGPEGNYLGDYGPYFTDRYKTPWGSAINYDGPESDEVRRFIVNNALYWVMEYHMDGLRIDAIHGIFDFSAQHILYEIREAVHHQAKGLGRHVGVIAESDLNDVRVINPPSQGGYGLDAQWNDDLHHCLHTLLTGEKNGYYEDFGDFNQLVKALQEGFVYSGQYSPYRRRRHGSSSKHLPPSKFVIFSQNHDQVGNRLKGDRLSTLVSLEALKLIAGIILLSPNIPLLFMGEEYGEEVPFQYFIHHSDQDLIEAVRKGRKEEFSAFQWSAETPDPQDEVTFLRSKIKLDLRHEGKSQTLLQFYEALIRLRKKFYLRSSVDEKDIWIEGFARERAILVRWEHGQDRVIGLFNLNDKPIKIVIAIEKGNWEKIFSSASEEWGGMEALVPESIHSTGSGGIFVLDANAFALYRKLKES
jgi:maltooligosyltrehalose trehalohydrolase